MSFLYFNNKIETVYSHLIIEVNFQLEAKDDWSKCSKNQSKLCKKIDGDSD